jgi:hypothetical protein
MENLMRPELGWAWLSQTERRAAEQALIDSGPDGTRDELGFSVVHFAYSDRFFPGTSVQQTSLRYVWFVCWSYLELQQRRPGGAFPEQELAEIENRTGRRLLTHYQFVEGKGIIGSRVLRTGRTPVVKPSAIYWNAMRLWGLIAQRDRECPGRGEVHARWDEWTSHRPRPEVDAEEVAALFNDPPPLPKQWSSEKAPLSFELDHHQEEGARIRRAWARLRDPRGQPTLLSRLAEQRAKAPSHLTAPEVLAVCTNVEEQQSLHRARDAGALAGVARALHTHMVQTIKDAEGKLIADTRQWLNDAVERHSEAASRLDLDSLCREIPEAKRLLPLMQATQKWLADGAGGVEALTPIYRTREMEQKPGRALLALDAGDRRDAWQPREMGPLTYRWERISVFLNELAGS